LFDTDPRPWTRKDLLEAMGKLVQEASKVAKLCFFIDGLDEFEGIYEDQQELIHFLRRLTTIPKYKNLRLKSAMASLQGCL
jgi:hypothetical protein